MYEMSAPNIRQGIISALSSRWKFKATVTLPAIPALVDHFVEALCTTWASMSQPYPPARRANLRSALESNLKEAYEYSPDSLVIVEYGTNSQPLTGIYWDIYVQKRNIRDEFDDFTKSRTPPYFGLHPDAMVMNQARSLGDSAQVTVLDIGAGTGRNALPLAREGFRVDVVEFAPLLLQVLQSEVAASNLSVRIFEVDILSEKLEVPDQYYSMMFLSEVVTHFRSVDEVRRVFDLANRLLAPGGIFLFNAFVAMDGYEPDEVARQMSEVAWGSMFTRHELTLVALATQLDCQLDEPALEYERSHLPADQWPPTGWYEAWCKGQDTIRIGADKSPVELRWLVFRKKSDPASRRFATVGPDG